MLLPSFPASFAPCFTFMVRAYNSLCVFISAAQKKWVGFPQIVFPACLCHVVWQWCEDGTGKAGSEQGRALGVVAV